MRRLAVVGFASGSVVAHGFTDCVFGAVHEGGDGAQGHVAGKGLDTGMRRVGAMASAALTALAMTARLVASVWRRMWMNS